jgi:Zn-dependent peptidase ImmA (M78 family)
MAITKEQLKNRALESYKELGYVDIIKIATELGIDVYGVEDKIEDAEIVYDENTGKFSINVNNSQVFTRQRFSVAHELAHYILHKDDIKEEKAIARHDKSDIGYDNREKEADDLAAELLLPEEALNDYISQLKIDKSSLINESTVRDISSKFKLSLTMVIVRLRKLGFQIPFILFA